MERKVNKNQIKQGGTRKMKKHVFIFTASIVMVGLFCSSAWAQRRGPGNYEEYRDDERYERYDRDDSKRHGRYDRDDYTRRERSERDDRKRDDRNNYEKHERLRKHDRREQHEHRHDNWREREKDDRRYEKRNPRKRNKHQGRKEFRGPDLLGRGGFWQGGHRRRSRDDDRSIKCGPGRGPCSECYGFGHRRSRGGGRRARRG